MDILRLIILGLGLAILIPSLLSGIVTRNITNMKVVKIVIGFGLLIWGMWPEITRYLQSLQ